MAFTWRYESADGAVFGEGGPALPEAATVEAFPSQSDAESWVGEAWRELAVAGVEAVTLFEDGRVVYGPMSLRP